jgi:hypothetical protein
MNDATEYRFALSRMRKGCFDVKEFYPESIMDVWEYCAKYDAAAAKEVLDRIMTRISDVRRESMCEVYEILIGWEPYKHLVAYYKCALYPSCIEPRNGSFPEEVFGYRIIIVPGDIILPILSIKDMFNALAVKDLEENEAC